MCQSSDDFCNILRNIFVNNHFYAASIMCNTCEWCSPQQLHFVIIKVVVTKYVGLSPKPALCGANVVILKYKQGAIQFNFVICFNKIIINNNFYL